MLVTNLSILVLAGFVGYAVISKVPNTLHTPLMSGTNAIHGIVVLGGILLLVDGVAGGFLNKLLLVIAVAFGTINVVGGFLGPLTYVVIFSVFAAIVGSVSFWGSNIAFAKLQELIDGKPVTIGTLQTPVNALLAIGAIACGVAIVSGSHQEILMILLLL